MFDAAGDFDLVERDAEARPAVAVGGLRDEGAFDESEDRCDDREGAMVATLGARGEAGVGEGDADAPRAGFGNEVRPDFGFDENELAGSDGIKRAPDAEFQIERVV